MLLQFCSHISPIRFFSLKIIMCSDNSFGVIIRADSEAFQESVPNKKFVKTVGSLFITCIGYIQYRFLRVFQGDLMLLL